MDKNYIYIGMLVEHVGDDCLVVSKNNDSCDLLYVDERKMRKDVKYDEINEIYNVGLKEYNKKMRGLGSQQNTIFSKNEHKKYIYDDGSRVWFTSDTHFFHDNILRFCNRPFTDVFNMNEQLIERWNSAVGPNDTVFHLGDVVWGGSGNWNYVLERLNGHIHLILGNHDVKNMRQGYMGHFESITFQRQIEVEGQLIYLNHFPMLTWAGVYNSTPIWSLFGHVHSINHGTQGGEDASRLQYLLKYQYDVGVDNNDYKPINFHEVKQIIDNRV